MYGYFPEITRLCLYNNMFFNNMKLCVNAYREHAYIILHGDGVKQYTCAFRVCSFTAWLSLLKCIKNDHKIQDMGVENVYIYILHS